MSNNLPAVLSDLTFGGVDLQRSDLSVHLDIESGLSDGLRVRGADTVVPGARGRTVRNRVADGRDILLVGIIQGAGASEADRLASWQNIRDALEAVFNPESLPATLTGHANDGTWRSIDARAVSVAYDPTPIDGVGSFSVSLDAAVSDWQTTGGGS